MVRIALRYLAFVWFIVILGVSGPVMARIPVFVSIVPQKYFVEQIGKDRVAVRVMVQPGASPATYEPKPRQMAQISIARVYFAVGVPFENAWLKKIAAANPKMKVVHTDREIEKIPMATHDHHEAQTGHKRGIPDPHIWLSPQLVKIQAHAILTALQEIDSSHGGEYTANYQQFVSKIDRLDAELKKLFAGRKGSQFMVFHPAWGYFAQAYGLEQVPVEIEGKNPKPAQLNALIDHARKQDIRVVFVQPQFSAQSAEVVAKGIRGRVAFADPLAEDWMANLRKVAAGFKAALK